MTSAGARSTERADNSKREAFTAAAVRLLGREGVSSLTTRRIAEEANLPAGIFHYWFASKADLLEAVLRAMLEDAAAVEPGITATDDPAQVWKAALRRTREDDVGNQLGAYELTAMALRNPEWRQLPRQIYETYHDMARNELAGYVDELNSRGAGLDLDVVASLVKGLVDGLTLAQLADPEGTPSDDVLDLAFRMLDTMGSNPRP